MAKLKKTTQFTKYALLSWPSVFASIVIIWLASQTSTMAEVYGRWWPVVTPLQVTSVTEEMVNGAPGSRISGYATIERDSCDYLSIEWSLHGENRSVRATAFFADEAQVRETGQQKWEALLVGVPPHKLSETTGDVHHQCGMFPVMTPFFRPDDSIVPTEVGATALCHSGAYTSSIGPGTCSGHGGIKEQLDGR